MKILALPRDPNPFQESLYQGVRERGFIVTYLAGPSGSLTVNVLLLPLILIVRRFEGFQVVHVHWVFGFVPTWASGRLPRRAFRYWYVAVLDVARLLGLRLVWTAHNILPHTPVFDDDARARRSLVRRCDHIVAMNSWVAESVRDRFAPRCAVSVIPHGVKSTEISNGSAGQTGRPRTWGFFGRIERYKGVTDLLDAFADADLPGDSSLIIGGECRDARLAHDILERASQSSRRIQITMRTLTDDELTYFLSSADVLVLPFNEISTSGSVLKAMSSGTPVVVPRLRAFEDIPEEGLFRYEPGLPGLREALEKTARLTSLDVERTTAAAARYLRTVRWDDVADEYVRLFRRVVNHAP